jgi:metallo-beta-lactamase family protein
LKIRFLGAADGVTGSRHLVESAGRRILLDCGMFQGFKLHRERNWSFPPELRELDAVIVSHAHLDHSGWLPMLVKHGWRGPIHATPATIALLEVMLLDSAHLQEEDARRANRGGWSRHAPARPLYTRADALKALSQCVPIEPRRTVRVAEHSLTLTPAGHLLGAASVTLRGPSRGGPTLVYSGDLGRAADLLMPAPEALPVARGATAVDALLVESTYGDRDHPADDAAERLAGIVTRTLGRGGSVLLPSFAVGRAQALLLVLQRLKRAGAIPHWLPVFLDSPMAERATALYREHARALRPPTAELRGLLDGVRVVQTAAQSMKVSALRHPAVIVASSGMATGGRVLHHLNAMLPDPRHSIVLAGFQAGGTRGARLVAGEREIRMFGQFVPVRAEVAQLEGLSGHADRGELMAWLGQFRQPPRQTFVVHGEPSAADALRARIQQQLGWAVRVPQHGAEVEL